MTTVNSWAVVEPVVVAVNGRALEIWGKPQVTTCHFEKWTPSRDNSIVEIRGSWKNQHISVRAASAATLNLRTQVCPKNVLQEKPIRHNLIRTVLDKPKEFRPVNDLYIPWHVQPVTPLLRPCLGEARRHVAASGCEPSSAKRNVSSACFFWGPPGVVWNLSSQCHLGDLKFLRRGWAVSGSKRCRATNVSNPHPPTVEFQGQNKTIGVDVKDRTCMCLCMSTSVHVSFTLAYAKLATELEVLQWARSCIIEPCWTWMHWCGGLGLWNFPEPLAQNDIYRYVTCVL